MMRPEGRPPPMKRSNSPPMEPRRPRSRGRGSNLQSRLLCLGWRDVREFLHEVVELCDVIVDVLVAVLGIEVACELGGFVGGDFLGRGLDVVADLFAGFVVPAA